MADLTVKWRTRATNTFGQDAKTWARQVTDNDKPILLRADDAPLDVVGEIGRSVVEVVGEKRWTWRRWNLMAEASRQTISWWFATMQDREAIVAMVADAAYTAWRADRDQGFVSVLIVETREDVAALNTRARADLILDGTLTPSREVALNDGTIAGIGDTVITRLNNRRLRTASGRDWVRNGDIWTITAVDDDGTITIARDHGTSTTVRRNGTIKARRRGRRFGGSVLLPSAYVAEHVDLGYAVTAYRAQGITTDTAHVLVEPTSTRETFYVAMTRGRHSNHAYVSLDRADDHPQPHPGDNPDTTAGPPSSAPPDSPPNKPTAPSNPKHSARSQLNSAEPKPTTTTPIRSCRASSPHADSATPTTSPPSSTTALSVRPNDPQDQAGLARHRDSSPASSQRHTESSTPTCERPSTNEKR